MDRPPAGELSGAWQDVEPVVWFGLIRAVLLVISLAATELARRRVDTGRSVPIARALMLSAAAWSVLAWPDLAWRGTFG